MKKHLYLSIIFFLVLATILSSYGNKAMAIEKAKYTVLEKESGFELRQYAPQIVAETVVEGDFETVGNEGFRRLYDYISGNNRKKQSIAMTAPVAQVGDSEKIAMTAPVNQVSVENKWRITFMMPSEYSLENLPAPVDERVVIKREPGKLVAAIKYSGTWSKSRYEEKKALLEKFIGERGLKIIGEPIWARYDPPFMPWFMRRNEVLIPVDGTSNVE